MIKEKYFAHAFTIEHFIYTILLLLLCKNFPVYQKKLNNFTQIVHIFFLVWSYLTHEISDVYKPSLE